MTTALGVACLTMFAMSEPSELPTVTADRPDATNGTFTVAPGVWQLEAGMDLVVPPGRTSGSERSPLAVPFTLRIGISERIELRTLDGDLEPWLHPRGRGGEGLALGAKVRLLDVVPGRRRSSLGLQPYVAWPSWNPRTWPGVELGLVGLWTQPVAAWLAFDANASLDLGVPGHPERPLGSRFSVSAQVTASSRFIPYAEVYALVDWRDRAGSVLAVDAGLVMVIARRLGFDLAARADVIAEEPEYGLLGGISVILADGVAWRRRALRGGTHGRARGS